MGKKFLVVRDIIGEGPRTEASTPDRALAERLVRKLNQGGNGPCRIEEIVEEERDGSETLRSETTR